MKTLRSNEARHNKDGQHPIDEEGWIDAAYLFGWNPARAARNRKMVANKEHIQGYLEIEAWLITHPRTEPVPAKYLGKVFQVGRDEYIPSYMHPEGIIIVDDDSEEIGAAGEEEQEREVSEVAH